MSSGKGVKRSKGQGVSGASPGVHAGKIRVSELTRVKPRLIRRFAARITEEDRRELLGTTGAADAALAARLAADARETLTGGGRLWAVRIGTRPAALFGARPDSPMAATAALWMVGTREAERRPLAFARQSRRCLAMAAAAFPQVTAFYNWVPERDERCLAWLRFLGARLCAGRTFRSPWTGEVFVMFQIDTDRKE